MAEDPRQIAAQFEVVQNELAKLDRRLATLQNALVEAQQAATTVAHLAGASETQAALLPLGGGVHVHATLDPTQKLVLPLGAGYSTEASAGDVAAALEARVKSIQEQFQRTNQEAERLAQVATAMQESLASADMV